MTAPTQSRLCLFAYGSNMLTARLRKRVPSAKAVGIGRLPGYALRWHKPSRDGSGKCDLEKTGRNKDSVWGVLFDVEPADKPALDRAEGLGKGYVQRRIDVLTDRATERAWAYVAIERNLGLRPYHWYKALVLAGAREHGLPAEYIQALESAPSSRDFDAVRTAENEKALAASRPSRQE